MEVTKCLLFLLVLEAATSITMDRDRRIEIDRNNWLHLPPYQHPGLFDREYAYEKEKAEDVINFKNVLDPIVDDGFKKCDCNEERYKICYEELGYKTNSKDMENFKRGGLPFRLRKIKGEFSFAGTNPGVPLYTYFTLGTPTEWTAANAKASFKVVQEDKKLIQTATWTDGITKQKRTSTITWEFSFGPETPEKRLRMVFALGNRKGICVYQVGDCPADYKAV